jgi:hypothetical protein
MSLPTTTFGWGGKSPTVNPQISQLVVFVQFHGFQRCGKRRDDIFMNVEEIFAEDEQPLPSNFSGRDEMMPRDPFYGILLRENIPNPKL